MVKGPANLRKFHRRKRDESHLKDSYFLCLKKLRNGMKLHQDRYLRLRRLSNLSPFGNVSHGVSFSVDLIFKRTRPMNITDAVTGNPRFNHIEPPCSFCMFTLLKLVICSHPNPMEFPQARA